jgi:hypothetical protein
VTHQLRVCVRQDDTFRNPNVLSSRHGCGSPSYEFRCPACNRTGRFNTNYLGKKKVVVCDGVKFDRRPFDLKMAVAEHDAADA